MARLTTKDLAAALLEIEKHGGRFTDETRDRLTDAVSDDQADDESSPDEDAEPSKADDATKKASASKGASK